MITLKSQKQLAKMRLAGELLFEVLQKTAAEVRPGVTTAYLNRFAEELIRSRGAVPSFLNYNGFPASICASADDVVVHGIPSESQVLKEGSILSIDCGVILDGWQSDSALTVGVGEISPEAAALIETTEACFWAAARKAKAGSRLGDIGCAVQSLAESRGYGVVRELTGHGIGREMHEDPAVYNYGQAGRGFALRPGMTIAVEPMITAGSFHTRTDPDGWGVRTRDGSLAAHYEHTIAITEDGLPEILSLPGFRWEADA